jgi:hypothetical protein
MSLNQPWLQQAVLQSFLGHNDSITNSMDNSKTVELISIIRQWRCNNSNHYYAEINQFHKALTARIKATARLDMKLELAKALETDWAWLLILGLDGWNLAQYQTIYSLLKDDTLKRICLSRIEDELKTNPDIDHCLDVISELHYLELYKHLIKRTDLNKHSLFKVGMAANTALTWRDILNKMNEQEAVWILGQIDSLLTLIEIAYNEKPQDCHNLAILDRLKTAAISLNNPKYVYRSMIKNNDNETINEIGEDVLRSFFAGENWKCLADWIVEANNDEFTELVLGLTALETPELRKLINRVTPITPSAFGVYSDARTIKIINANIITETLQGYLEMAILTGKTIYIDAMKPLIK